MASEKLTLTGPSGREYVWDKDTPPTPTDIAVLIEADRIYAAEQEGEKEKTIKQAASITGGSMAPSGMVPIRPEMRGEGPLAETITGAGPAAVEGAIATTAQAGGAALAGPPGAAVAGAAGGFLGNLAAQALRGGQISLPEATGAAASAFVPGKPLAKAGAAMLGREALKQAGANVSGLALQRLMEGKELDPKEAATYAGLAAIATSTGKLLDPGKLADREAINMVVNQEMMNYAQKAQAMGFKVLPSTLNKTKINDLIEALGGRQLTIAEMREMNEDLFTAIAAKDVGVTPALGQRLDRQLRAAAEKAAQPMAEIKGLQVKAQADLDALEKKSALAATNEHELQILRSDPEYVRERAKLGKQAGADVEKFREANSKKNDYYKRYETGRDPEDLKLAKEFEKRAEDARASLEEGLSELGRPELYTQWNESRRLISKIKELEDIITPAGKIPAEGLSQAINRGVPFDARLKTLAQFASEPRFRSVTTSEYTNRPEAGRIGSMADAFLSPIRSMVASEAYQSRFARPIYSDMPDSIARFAKTATQADLEERQKAPNSLLNFYAQAYPRTPPTQAIPQPTQ